MHLFIFLFHYFKSGLQNIFYMCLCVPVCVCLYVCVCMCVLLEWASLCDCPPGLSFLKNIKIPPSDIELKNKAKATPSKSSQTMWTKHVESESEIMFIWEVYSIAPPPPPHHSHTQKKMQLSNKIQLFVAKYYVFHFGIAANTPNAFAPFQKYFYSTPGGAGIEAECVA